jgi:glyoxylase-like metal-dependent hydrolase (beta-lactamase superfamily II)
MQNESQTLAVNHSFSFRLGDLECQVIRDTVGRKLSLDRLFPAIKEKGLDQVLNRLNIEWGEAMNVMCLLLRLPQQLVLIDTGWGGSQQPDRGQLIPVLRGKGIKPEDISTVIISHGHPDHIGGNTDEKGNPLFPQARYIIFKKEWDYWTSFPDLPTLDKKIQQEMHFSVRKNLIPLKERFTLVDENTEFLPGIKFIQAPGHSRYHCILDITSGSRRLIYSSDLFHHPVQVMFPELGLFTDFDPAQSCRARTEFISQAVKTSELAFAGHFPFPGLGCIQKNGDYLTWQPQT